MAQATNLKLTGRHMSLLGLASNGVYMCPRCYQQGGSLLHCPSTLTGLWPAVYFCCTVPGVASAGLGNRDVTPDALGPYVVSNICITRHMIREFGTASLGEEQRNPVSGIVPGVMAQTGMETLEIIRGVVKETHPDLIIAVDALAARSTRRLNRTIQITDTGINPGSGVGNHRNGLNKQVLGIPVIAIGVPTVVDAATIVNDTMESLIHALDMEDYAQKYQLIKERIPSHLNTMFVTPKDIDETVKRLSYTISEGLNLALQLA